MTDREDLPSGESLRLRRLARRLSQREVAHRTGIQQSMVSYIETGARLASVKSVKRYADFLDAEETTG